MSAIATDAPAPAADSTAAGKPLVELTGVAKYFGRVPRRGSIACSNGSIGCCCAPVDGVSFTIHSGRDAGRWSANRAAAKSTIARMIVGLFAPTRGVIRFDGQDTSMLRTAAGAHRLRRRLQMIFQDPLCEA